MSAKQGVIFRIKMSHPIFFYLLVSLNLATPIRYVFMILLIQFLTRQQLFKAGRGPILTMAATRCNFLPPPFPLESWSKFSFRPHAQVFSAAVEESRGEGRDQGGCNLGHLSQQLDLQHELTLLVKFRDLIYRRHS